MNNADDEEDIVNDRLPVVTQCICKQLNQQRSCLACAKIQHRLAIDSQQIVLLWGPDPVTLILYLLQSYCIVMATQIILNGH